MIHFYSCVPFNTKKVSPPPPWVPLNKYTPEKINGWFT